MNSKLAEMNSNSTGKNLNSTGETPRDLNPTGETPRDLNPTGKTPHPLSSLTMVSCMYDTFTPNVQLKLIILSEWLDSRGCPTPSTHNGYTLAYSSIYPQQNFFS